MTTRRFSLGRLWVLGKIKAANDKKNKEHTTAWQASEQGRVAVASNVLELSLVQWKEPEGQKLTVESALCLLRGQSLDTHHSGQTAGGWFCRLLPKPCRATACTRAAATVEDIPTWPIHHCHTCRHSWVTTSASMLPYPTELKPVFGYSKWFKFFTKTNIH